MRKKLHVGENGMMALMFQAMSLELELLSTRHDVLEYFYYKFHIYNSTKLSLCLHVLPEVKSCVYVILKCGFI